MDIAESGSIIEFQLPSDLQSRMWEMRVIQLPFEQRAPAGCLQFFDSPRGNLKTLNYLPNGRYLANQDYLLCVRQERGMCSISYSPCTSDSFRIGPSRFVAGVGNGTRPSTSSPANGDVVEGSGTADTSMTSVPISSRRCSDRVLIPCDFEEFITVIIIGILKKKKNYFDEFG